MSAQRRVDNLYLGLTVEERVLLAVRWFKEDAEVPPAFRRAMPALQAAEVNRELRFADAAHHEVSWYALWLQARLERVSLRLGMVTCLQLWELQADRILTELICGAGEPVTQSEYAERLAAARAEVVPVGALAEILTERDAERDGLDEGQYARRLGEHERELRHLAENGGLPHKGRGNRLGVSAGAFYDWLGEETPVGPEWGLRLEVFPDEAAEQVARLRAQREAMMRLVDEAPRLSAATDVESEGETGARTLARDLIVLGQAELRALCAELIAVETVVGDAAERFSSEEPIHPAARRLLDEVADGMGSLRRRFQEWSRDYKLPEEPDVQVVEALTQIVARQAGE